MSQSPNSSQGEQQVIIMWLNLTMLISHITANTIISTMLNLTMASTMLDQAMAITMLSHITLDLTTAIVTQLPSIMSGLAAIHTTALTMEDIPLDIKQPTSEDLQHPTEHLIIELHTEDQVVQYLSEAAQHHSEEDQHHSEVAIMDCTEVGQQVISEEVQVLSEEDLAHIRSAEDQEAHQASEGDHLADQDDTECPHTLDDADEQIVS